MAKSLLEKFENVNKTMSKYPEYLSEIKFGVLDSFLTKDDVLFVDDRHSQDVIEANAARAMGLCACRVG